MIKVDIFKDCEKIHSTHTDYKEFRVGSLVEVGGICYIIANVCYCFSDNSIQLTVEEE